MTSNRRLRRAWILVAAGMASVLLLAFAENLGSNFLYSVMLHVPGVDKALHFCQSFLVCYLLSWLLARTGVSMRTRLVAAAGGALAAAGFDELQQTFRSDRSIELADIGAGAAGILAAVAVLAHASSRRWALAMALVAMIAGGAITYSSYLLNRDYNRGVLAEQAGRRDEALGHYLHGVENGIENPDLFNAASWLISESNGDRRRAVELAERSLQLRPKHADTLDTYGWALYRAGRSADAIAPLEAAFAAKPNIYCIHFHLGMVYLSLNRRDLAIQHLREQVERLPNTREATQATQTLATLESSVRNR